MLKLIWFVQIVFFLVSMLLTGLFAMSLSGGDFDGLIQAHEDQQSIFMAALFVLIGCCIDIGKYLFWAKRHISRFFTLLSVVLMAFSWAASCAFFISSEMRLLKDAQYGSPEYIALQQEISAIQRSIDIEERLLDKRLGSSYHKQWEQAQASAMKIASLQVDLREKRATLPLVGSTAAESEIETTRLFASVSGALNVSLDTVRTFGYAVLALLLEVSTLGMISLARAEKTGGGISVDKPTEPDSKSDDTLLVNEEYRQKLAILTSDILSGKIPPVLRTIKSASYGLNLDQIRTVLSDLHSAGILDTDKRNSYKLSERVSCQPVISSTK
ncbi:hypothetical protein R50073_48870 (plasmid) [Maricurvus nonylphenolicus]|uniref:hypothetical protein n=1 Tax=Maricurvus nonylphenolicus TaxID=1008307 RepID=UPI0036F387A9